MAVVGSDNLTLRLMNRVFAQMHGYELEELKNADLKELISPDSLEPYFEETEILLRQGRRTFEAVHVRRDGTAFPAQIDMTFMGEDDGVRPNYWVLNVQDITDKKIADENREQLERRLRQAQKMESIGTLAGGIAHDFNNILGAIFGYAEIALLRSDDPEDVKKNLGNLLLAAERARDLVRRILAFSRQAEVNISPAKVNPVIEEAVKFLRSSIPANIEIRYNPGAEETMIMVDRTQFHQVIMNLGANAAHAMREKGGILEISASELSIKAGTPAARLRPGKYVLLTVSDTGKGMDRVLLERIFEPYFTTKGQEEGAGLGLAVVHGIIAAHGGDISVYSEPSMGTSFKIYLPVINEERPREQDNATEIPKGSEKILFVDDEEPLIEVSLQLLQHLGYTVETRTNGRDALERLNAGPDDFDLIITDNSMPGMTGIELAQKIRAIRADIPIILCTGLSNPMSTIQARDAGIVGFLMKPLILQNLACTVRSALDGKTA